MPIADLIVREAMRAEPLRAFVYDRVSRIGRKATTGNEDQDIENRRLCERYGWTVVGSFSDPGRGASRHSKTDRPQFRAMLERVAAGECDVVVAWEASRLQRDLEVYVGLRKLCERHHVLLCYNGTLYDMSKSSDRFITTMGAAQAEFEADAIRDRILRTTRLNAERGRPHGRTPYGYRRVYDERTGDLLEQVVYGPEAVVVREVTARVAAGQSLYSIAKDLNRRGLPSPGGAEWTLMAVRTLVLRPTNIGQRQHQGAVIGDAQWAPILEDEADREAYFAAVKILKDPSRLTHRDSIVRYLMSGLVTCGACAQDPEPAVRILRPRHSSGKRSYVCTECFRVSMRTDLMDEVAQGVIVAYVERPEFAAALKAGRGDSAAAALAEVQAMETQLAEARTLAKTFEGGRFRLSPLALADMEAELLPRIEASRARAQDATVPVALRNLAGPGAAERWEELDLAEKRTIIRDLVKVRLNRTRQGVRKIEPRRITWDWQR
jgi:DNA invertase Pin-like site-specific DNA recombinase